jgi:hypothetical protein
MGSILDIIGTVVTGGATGIIGSIIGKVFGFVEAWQEEKKEQRTHERTLAMLEVQHKHRSADLENERLIVQEEQDGKIKNASYLHDRSAGLSYPWVAAILRLIRPVLTIGLIIILWLIYKTTTDVAQQEEIVLSVIYMSSTAVLWWFGDRAMKRR